MLKKNQKLFFAISFLLTVSCDNNGRDKLDCSNYQYDQTITLKGFKYSETDSCSISLFNKDTCIEKIYIIKADISFDKKTNDIYIHLKKKLSTKYNWEIVLCDSLKYFISDFITKTRYENTMLTTNKVCALESYKLNNVIIQSDYITIER